MGWSRRVEPVSDTRASSATPRHAILRLDVLESCARDSDRSGLGKLRHLETHTLWVQEKVRNGAIA